MDQHVTSRSWSVELQEEYGHHDITPELRELIAASGIRNGLVVVQLVGSTGGITTIEYESGALADLRNALDRIAATDAHYEHNARWGDGNGFSHLRSALMKTSCAVPILDGSLALGTWQQVVVFNLDNRARTRNVVAVALGES